MADLDAPPFVLVAGLIIIAVSSISIICSVLTIFILYKLQTWNGYVLLVHAVAVSQLFYDASFYFLIPNKSYDYYCIYRAWNSASGVAVILWINVMSALVLYTTSYLVSFRVKDRFFTISVVIGILSIAMGIPDFITCVNEPENNITNWIYFGVRLFSILFNILSYLYISVLIHLPYSVSFFNWTLSDIGLRRKTNDLLIVLITRLKYYPIVQVITRVVALVWDAKLGFSKHSWSNSSSTQVRILQIFYDLTNPFAGVGYFLVFLWVQPSAYECFLLLCRHFCYYLTFGCGERPPPLSSITSPTLQQQRHLSQQYMSNRFRSSVVGDNNKNPHGRDGHLQECENAENPMVIPRSHATRRSTNTTDPRSVSKDTAQQHFSVDQSIVPLAPTTPDNYPVRDFYLYSLDLEESTIYGELQRQLGDIDGQSVQGNDHIENGNTSDQLPTFFERPQSRRTASVSTISRDSRNTQAFQRSSATVSSRETSEPPINTDELSSVDNSML